MYGNVLSTEKGYKLSAVSYQQLDKKLKADR